MKSEQPSTVILSIGHDPELLSIRNLLLRSAGYIVQSASSIERAINSFREGDFDLVVMCHSLSEEERVRLTRYIREDGSSVPIIGVAAGSAGYTDICIAAGSAAYTDQFAATSRGSRPAELLHNIEALLEQERSLYRR